MAEYVCLECGEEFDEPAKWEESRGEFWGFPCSETMYGCPYCHGDYEEKTEVKHGHWEICCDGYYPYCSECMYEPEKMTDICPNCSADMRGDAE